MHHEYLDGSGLPAHLTSKHIPRHARIVMVVNEFINQISNETQKFAPESLLNARSKMSALMENGKIDAEILDTLYKRLGGISELLAFITSILLS